MDLLKHFKGESDSCCFLLLRRTLLLLFVSFPILSKRNRAGCLLEVTRHFLQVTKVGKGDSIKNQTQLQWNKRWEAFEALRVLKEKYWKAMRARQVLVSGLRPWVLMLTDIRLPPSRDWHTGTLSFFIITFQRDGSWSKILLGCRRYISEGHREDL